MATSGKYHTCRVGALPGTPFTPRSTRWEAREVGDNLDDTSAFTNGYTSTSHGVNGVEISVDFLFDVADVAFPTVGKGTLLSQFRVFANANQAGPADYFLPVAIVIESSRPVEVRGQIRGSYTVANVGEFQRDGLPARTV